MDRTEFILIALIAAASPLLGAAYRKIFESSNGFSVEYPGTWHLESLSRHFYIESFPPSETVRGVRLPPGGASITITVPLELKKWLASTHREMPTNLEEWVAAGTWRQRVISKRSLEVGDGPRRIAVVEVIAQCCAVAPFQESVNWYFETERRMFLASLQYWQDDSKADKLREILRQVVLSLKVNRH